jgi:acyl-CoA thioesterase-1
LPNVLILGDSISVGYTPTVRELLRRKVNVFRPVKNEQGDAENCGGTTMSLQHIDRWLGTTRWDLIHFNWGLHDIKRVRKPGDAQSSDNPNDPRQADVKTYEANIAQLVARMKRTGARLVFGTTTPVPADLGQTTIHRTASDVPQYNAAALRVMRRHGAAVNDLYGFILPQLDRMQQPKNVHFTPEGYRVLGEQVARVIAEALPHKAV